MDTLKIGKIIKDKQQKDAVHMAIAPVIAGRRLSAGQHVGVNAAGMAFSELSPIGIVDPFLLVTALEGDTFWLFLYPGSITSLRHDWTHPAFVQAEIITPRMTHHESWVEDLADRIGTDYETLMAGADEWVKWREYLNLGSTLQGEYLPHEFWEHYEAIRSTEVPEELKENFFSCSC
jgi:hypothetical protein